MTVSVSRATQLADEVCTQHSDIQPLESLAKLTVGFEGGDIYCGPHPGKTSIDLWKVNLLTRAEPHQIVGVVELGKAVVAEVGGKKPALYIITQLQVSPIHAPKQHTNQSNQTTSTKQQSRFMTNTESRVNSRVTNQTRELRI